MRSAALLLETTDKHRSDLVRRATIYASPFLRYPGGKRRMLDFILPLLPPASEIPGLYAEPFVGGASVFLALNPLRPVLSDTNHDLIGLYKAIRLAPSKVWRIYEEFPTTSKGFYSIRSADVVEKGEIYKAARLLYLNRTCFNGMWRHNSDGKFTVGYGGQERRWAISKQDLTDVSAMLKKATLVSSDFESVIDYTGSGDFLFLDPPYRPAAKEIVWDHYSGLKFTFDEQIRLSRTLQRATARGVRWAMTNSSHPAVLNLYENHDLTFVPKGTGGSPGVMVSNPGEVLIRNYQ